MQSLDACLYIPHHTVASRSHTSYVGNSLIPDSLCGAAGEEESNASQKGDTAPGIARTAATGKPEGKTRDEGTAEAPDQAKQVILQPLTQLCVRIESFAFL